MGYTQLMHNLAKAKKAGWQPIDTVPKGEVILFFPKIKSGRNSHLHQMIVVGHASGYPFRAPTHWMPLPPAPEGTTDAD